MGRTNIPRTADGYYLGALLSKTFCSQEKDSFPSLNVPGSSHSPFPSLKELHCKTESWTMIIEVPHCPVMTNDKSGQTQLHGTQHSLYLHTHPFPHCTSTLTNTYSFRKNVLPARCQAHFWALRIEQQTTQSPAYLELTFQDWLQTKSSTNQGMMPALEKNTARDGQSWVGCSI